MRHARREFLEQFRYLRRAHRLQDRAFLVVGRQRVRSEPFQVDPLQAEFGDEVTEEFPLFGLHVLYVRLVLLIGPRPLVQLARNEVVVEDVNDAPFRVPQVEGNSTRATFGALPSPRSSCRAKMANTA